MILSCCKRGEKSTITVILLCSVSLITLFIFILTTKTSSPATPSQVPGCKWPLGVTGGRRESYPPTSPPPPSTFLSPLPLPPSLPPPSPLIAFLPLPRFPSPFFLPYPPMPFSPLPPQPFSPLPPFPTAPSPRPFRLPPVQSPSLLLPLSLPPSRFPTISGSFFPLPPLP